jgi:hypothetical protein
MLIPADSLSFCDFWAVFAYFCNTLLGTYTKKFLILDREYGSNNRELAMAHGITIIELPSASTQNGELLGELSKKDREKLIETVKVKIGG